MAGVQAQRGQHAALVFSFFICSTSNSASLPGHPTLDTGHWSSFPFRAKGGEVGKKNKQEGSTTQTLLGSPVGLHAI